ncbi:hypothetical protein EXIGLDRAFT_755769 [Exidia glandulosa HHB12029]|uniref:Uncharacterized protein n=1 Tax=Exidia glandulosa HHB12029 TaxID=1314781 RepID=A0A165BRZ1_EXIGL|nr:hypothetical protein EXIGLDRAFT_755769 [Exidia glandulosa HHB12029]
MDPVNAEPSLLTGRDKRALQARIKALEEELRKRDEQLTDAGDDIARLQTRLEDVRQDLVNATSDLTHMGSWLSYDHDEGADTVELFDAIIDAVNAAAHRFVDALQLRPEDVITPQHATAVFDKKDDIRCAEGLRIFLERSQSSAVEMEDAIREITQAIFQFTLQRHVFTPFIPFLGSPMNECVLSLYKEIKSGESQETSKRWRGVTRSNLKRRFFDDEVHNANYFAQLVVHDVASIVSAWLSAPDETQRTQVAQDKLEEAAKEIYRLCARWLDKANGGSSRFDYMPFWGAPGEAFVGDRMEQRGLPATPTQGKKSPAIVQLPLTMGLEAKRMMKHSDGTAGIEIKVLKKASIL